MEHPAQKVTISEHQNQPATDFLRGVKRVGIYVPDMCHQGFQINSSFVIHGIPFI
jgi:hypothetical protein